MATDRRGTWIGVVVAVVAGGLLTVLGAAAEGAINGDGSNVLAPPIFWGLGGAIGVTAGAVTAALLTRRFRPAFLAATAGALVVLLIVVLGYNSDDLRLEDQVVGSLLIVVLPGYFGALTVSALIVGALRVGGPRVGRPQVGSTTTAASA